MSKFGRHRHAHHLKRSRTKKVAPIKKNCKIVTFSSLLLHFIIMPRVPADGN